jgi:hypothetical protein
MINESFTVQDVLFILLKDGWKWSPSDNPGMVAIEKDGFKWHVEPFYLELGSLLDMLRAYGVHIGTQGLLE